MSTASARVRALATLILIAPLMAYPIDAAAAKGGGGGGGGGGGAGGGGKADRAAPSVSIMSPASGSSYTTAQTVTVSANASDNVGVSRVEFYDNGVLQGTDSSAPFSHAWSISSSGNGSHSWAARAFDATGNTGTSGTVAVTVNVPVADTIAPSSAIASPASGASYTSAQTVTVSASASDNVGVARVEFYDNGVLKGSDTSAPYGYAWSVTSASNGSHSWTAKAYDAAGRVGTSGAAGVTVSIAGTDATAPSTSIASPTSGTTYTTTTTVTVAANASDNVGVARVEFYRNGALQSTDTASPYSHAWSVSSSVNGSHSWTAKAYDTAGNSAVSAASSVTVNIASTDTTAPAVSITSPGSGATYTSAQTVTVAASASDNVGVTRVEFYLDGVQRSIVTAAPFTYAWSLSSAVNGTHSWTAKAYDAAGNVKTSSAVSVTVNIAATDITKPSVSITSPASGANYTTAQTVTVAASANDNVGVARVDFYDGSTLKGSDSTAPYSYAWSVSSSVNGTHSWTARAFDAAGNNTTSTAVSLSVNVVASANGGAHIWSRMFGGAMVDRGQGVANDANGNVVFTGYYSNTVSFNGTPLPCTSSRNMVVAKYDVRGTPVWAQCVGGGAGSLNANKVAVGPDGSIAVIGEFTQSVTFGTQTLTSVGAYDVFVAKYSAAGELLWAVRSGSSLSDYGRSVVVDGLGDVVASGDYHNPDLIFVTKYSALGATKWSRQFSGQGNNTGQSVAVDGQNNVLLSGVFYGTLQLDGSTTSITSQPDYASDIVLAKFNAAGSFLWVRRVGGDQAEAIGEITADQATGEIVMTGSFKATVDFGAGPVTANSDDLFLVKFDSAGRHLWSNTYGGTGLDVGSAVAIDPQTGDVFMAGRFAYNKAFGGATLTNTGSEDIVVARYAASTGAHVWSKAFGGPYADAATDLAVDSAGHLNVTGYFVKQVDFGGGLLAGDAAYGDAFVVQLAR